MIFNCQLAFILTLIRMDDVCVMWAVGVSLPSSFLHFVLAWNKQSLTDEVLQYIGYVLCSVTNPTHSLLVLL